MTSGFSDPSPLVSTRALTKADFGQHGNNADGQLTAPIGTGALSIPVDETDRCPDAAIIILGDEPDTERVLYTSKSVASGAGNLILTDASGRGFDGSTPQSWPIGTPFVIAPIAYSFNRPIAELVEISRLIHGAAQTTDGFLVFTTKSQTLTNKTLTSPILQGTVGAGSGLTMPTFDLAGAVITGSGAPSASGDLVNKAYVDTLALGLDWQESVLDRNLTAPPGGPSTGDRYLVASGATGAWATHDLEIAEWNGTSWDFWVPNEGYTVWVEDENLYLHYNGAAWVTFGSTLDHGSLLGLGDDDHPQYLLASGARALTGNWAVGGFALSGVTQVTHTAGLVLGADTDASGTDTLTLQTRGTSRLVLENDGSLSFKQASSQDYKLSAPSTTTLAWTGQASGNGARWAFSSFDADGSDNVNLDVMLVGASSAATDRELLTIQAVGGAQRFDIASLANGSGTVRPVHLYTSGNPNQVVLVATGRVGFGRSPTTEQVESSGGIASINSGVSLTNVLTYSGAVGLVGTTTNHPIGVIANNTERARFDQSGNFVLGATNPGDNAGKVFAVANGTDPTSSPENMFQLWARDIYTAGGAGAVVRDEFGHRYAIGGASATTSTLEQVVVTEATNNRVRWDAAAANISDVGTSVFARIEATVTQATPSALKGDLRFFYNAGDSLAEGMRLSDAGRVGIGTTNPDELLHLRDATPRLKFERTGATVRSWDWRVGSDGQMALQDLTGVVTVAEFGTNGGLGLGGLPSARLHVYTAQNETGLLIDDTTGTNEIRLQSNISGIGNLPRIEFVVAGASEMALSADVDKMNILRGSDSGVVATFTEGRNFGLGTSSPSNSGYYTSTRVLHVADVATNGRAAVVIDGDAAGSSSLEFWEDGAYKYALAYDGVNNRWAISTTDANGAGLDGDVMRIPDGADEVIFMGGVGMYGTAPPATRPTYTPTNDVTDRAFDADTVAITELADVVATMIRDLGALGVWGLS